MSKFTKEEVLKLASLARLKLSEAEIEKYKTELSDILAYIDMLDSVDTAGLEPTFQVTGLTNVSRDDVVEDQPTNPDTLVAMAPDSQGRYIKVKRMI